MRQNKFPGSCHVPLVVEFSKIMKVIGITGGVGAGKSEILKYIEREYNARIVMTDRLAESLEAPGGPCYEPLIELLGEGILETEALSGADSPKLKPINRKAMAALIFNDESLLKRVNEIVHPRVLDYLKEDILSERKKGELDYYFVESALISKNPDFSFIEEFWYIYTANDIRIERLMAGRGYSLEKSQSIMDAQKPDSYYREFSDHIIDNSACLNEAYRQIDGLLKS